MKKFLSLLLAVLMLLGCLPALAEDDPEWKINQHTGLVSRNPAAEKLDSIVVPAEVNGMAVRGIEYMAFSMHKNFKHLTIADGAAMLDRRVLRDLLKLEAVELPENLLVIREGNFTNLPKLTSVVIPANVVLVHSSFNKCASLASITFEGMCPLFVTEGSFGMFTDLPADCVIYVPDNQVDAYKAAFADRKDVAARIQPSGKRAEAIDRPASETGIAFDASTGTITSYTGSADYLVIPDTIGGVQVKHIADFAFETNVCCIMIPEGVETLGRYSLGRELLSYVSLPSTLTNVGAGAFSSSRVSAIAYPVADVPAYEAAAFDGIKSDAWQLILPFGTSQEQVDAFAAYMAASAPKATVKASIIEPYSFPKLDAEAGAAFIGKWNGVAATDGTDFYGMDLLDMSVAVELLEDGTGTLAMDTENTAGGWYMDNGAAIFAPVLEEGGNPSVEDAATFTLDENGRLCIDFGGIILLLEQEGKVYDTPAIPERPWPDLDAEKAQAYLGTWDAVSYIVDGETISVELAGPMTLILKADGTAQMLEEEEEGYELRWYAESYSAYVGPTMSAAVELFFDMNGNLQMMQDGAKVVFKPHVEATPVPTPEPTPEPTPVPTPEPTPEPVVIEGADELLGDWYDDLSNKLTLVSDGTMTYTYASDGWTYEEKWDVVDGAAMVTEGRWAGASIYMRDGIVLIDDDEGVFQLFSRDGDLSAYYGEEEEELPEAQPIGPEGEAFFGTWQMEIMPGMAMILTLNQDGTCAMDVMGEVDSGVWSVVDGKADVMGMIFEIDGSGQLVCAEQGMVFATVGSDEPAADSISYIDVTFVLSRAETIYNGQKIPLDAAAFGEYKVRFNSDGSAELTQSGLALESQHLTWSVTDAGAYLIDYSVGGVFIMDYTFLPVAEGVTLDNFGTLMTFTPAE